MCQNISEEVFLAASKNEAKIHFEDCVQGGGQLYTLSLKRKG